MLCRFLKELSAMVIIWGILPDFVCFFTTTGLGFSMSLALNILSLIFKYMRKLHFLLFLLFMAVEAGAKIVTTPEVGKAYLIKCIATDDHTGFLGDDGTTLQGRHVTGTLFLLEAATDGVEGHYYIKSKESGKYINAADVTDGAAITFDTEAITYWTIDQTNANMQKKSWAIRPNGTAGLSLNNNGNANVTCPYLKIMSHTNSGQGCCLWTFDDGEPAPYEKPQFGGTVWTWNTANNNFDAEGKESTATPGRENSRGPVYKFENVGNVTTAVNGSTDTSDKGGIWVISNTSNVTSSLGRWAGSILVEDDAVAVVNYSKQLKGTEDADCATVWTNGTLSFSGRTEFEMNDGGNQRWYIGENGVINTGFTGVSKGDRNWEINVVVADVPARDGETRVKTTIRKKVMTWGADISSNINSISVWYKDADGNLTHLDADAVSYDATGITISYEGLGYAEVSVGYTIHSDILNEDYTGKYMIAWAGDRTALPAFVGASGYSLTDAVFTKDGDTYSLTAKINFPFPVSNATVQNATGIESELGSSKWIVNDEEKIVANNAANTILNYSKQDNFKWYIYPSFSDGTFNFKIKHSSGKYIPTITAAQSTNTANAVVEEGAAGSYYFMPCTGNGSGFSISAEGAIFLTVNTSGSNQNIWTWNKPANSGHKGSNLSFPDVTITKESVQTQFNTLKNAAKFDILEGSTVQGPSEFANPTEINAAIDAAAVVDAEDITAIEDFLATTEASKIKNYLAKMEQYGTLYNYQFEVARQYSTIILPCPSTRPEGITLYSCNATKEDGYTLVLTSAGNFAFNTPYIMESTVGNKYTIIGWDKNSRATHTSGWLTGVLTENGATVPADSYVLAYQKSADKQGFFKTDGTVNCPQNKCYLTPAAAAQSVKAFYFYNDGEATGIEGIVGNNDENVVIYDLSGRRLNKLQKGVNIVNGRKVLVK